MRQRLSLPQIGKPYAFNILHFSKSKKKNKIFKVLNSLGLKAGFHWRRSRSRSRNQKPRAIRSSENQTVGVGSRTLIPLMTPSLTISWKLDCRSLKRKRKNKPMLFVELPPCCLSNCTRRTWGLALWLVYSSASASDSDNLVFTVS